MKYYGHNHDSHRSNYSCMHSHSWGCFVMNGNCLIAYHKCPKTSILQKKLNGSHCKEFFLPNFSVPGYVGCFKPDSSLMINLLFSDDKIESEGLSISGCRLHCRHQSFRYAFLLKGSMCYCSNETNGERVDDSECQTECSGDSNQACGSDMTVSAYDGIML